MTYSTYGQLMLQPSIGTSDHVFSSFIVCGQICFYLFIFLRCFIKRWINATPALPVISDEVLYLYITSFVHA
jgi:hypothetical protein